jgi:excisionase family DNA binding protein
MNESLLSTGDAARLLGISAEYLRNLADSGRLPAERTVSGQRIFRSADIQEFQSKREQKKGERARRADNHG